MQSLSQNYNKNVIDQNKPRKLTEDEIQDILGILSDLKSASKQVSDKHLKSMKVLVREQLKQLYITLLGINDLKSEIARQFKSSIVRPGEAVGIGAAEAMAKPITQGALDSFHQSGSKKNVTHGIDRIKEIIYATKNPKKTSADIYFKDQNRIFDDIIIDKRPGITDITVGGLIIGIPDIEKPDEFEEPYWYDIYRELYRDDFKSNHILKLQLDVNQLYAYKLTMEDVCRVLERDQPVICVSSPMPVGQIHIYPIERNLTSKLKDIKVVSYENASLVFLTMIVIPTLDELRISGIKGIVQIFPVETPVWQIVKEERVEPSVDNGYFLILSEIRMISKGITADKLIALLEVAGIKVIKKRPNYLLVETPNGESPTTLVNDLIKRDKEDEKQYERKKRTEGARIIQRPPTEIMKASTLVYADSTGSNFIELLSHPDVDSTRTICNNVHEVRDALGIEAARNFYINEFVDVINYESYVNPRHIVLMVDFMTSLGRVYGVTFSGVSRQTTGILEMASFEKSMDIFKEGSGFGKTQKIEGTSASIYVGKKALVGTGYSEQYLDSTKFDQLRKKLDEEADIVFDANSFNDAIEGMTEITMGNDIAMLEGLEEEMFGVGVEDEELVVKSNKNKTKIYNGGNNVPDKRVRDKGKAGIVRSKTFEESAKELNNAPCLRPKAKSKISVSNLPFTQGTEHPVPEKTGELPAGLLADMKKFTVEPAVPKVPAKIPTKIPDLPMVVPESKIQIFSLEDFLK